MSKKGGQNQYSLMGSSKGGGYTASNTTTKKINKKVGGKVESVAAPAAPIGCNSQTVYQPSYTVARRFPGSITGSLEQFAEMEKSGCVPQWILQNLDAVKYRAGKDPRGSKRHGGNRGLVKECSMVYLKNSFPFQVLLASSEMAGRVYSQDGKRGLISAPSDSCHMYQNPEKIYLSTEISDAFLRFADLDAKALAAEKHREITRDEDNNEVIHYVVHCQSRLGVEIGKNTVMNTSEKLTAKERENLLSVGIGPQYQIQLHPVAKNCFRLTPEQLAEVSGLVHAASQSGRPINMGCLDISVMPVDGCWADPCALKWAADSREMECIRKVPFTVEFELEIVYRLIDHPDMKQQKERC